MDKNRLYVGLDLGSTTAKVVVLDKGGRIIFSDYRRHNTEILRTLSDILMSLYNQVGDRDVSVRVTGTAGMGISERFQIPFVQEVVASCETVNRLYKDVRTLIDIGGEDSKLILFNRSQPDIRMNGNCAGGTGAFIDQMSRILNISHQEMNEFALKYKRLYPISSRCGVFARTDIQNMVSRRYDIEDICASIFQAVAIQTVNALARGCDIEPIILFSGGPLSFLSALRDAFKRVLKLKDKEIILPVHPELVVAQGAALIDSDSIDISLLDLIENIRGASTYNYNIGRRLEPLFSQEEELSLYSENLNVVSLMALDYENARDGVYLGIDSGSTTTKVVLIDRTGKIVSYYYVRNNGNPIQTVRNGLDYVLIDIRSKIKEEPKILFSAVTGYGEELIRKAFGIDSGIVETMAHFKGASMLNPDVSFILDIGGQDMKAMFIVDGFLNNLIINEACSSGCGSFLSSFSDSLSIDIKDFAKICARSDAPCDLGTRCTVFMGSKIKQALKEGATISDITAGLAYSVIKNCLYKMLRLKDVSELGENIVVQGGTFKNLAILRAFEKEIGKKVYISDVPELMGAFGAALYAKELSESTGKRSGFDFKDIATINYRIDNIRCAACENRCEITRYTFENGNKYYNGNRCERIYSNRAESETKGFNFVEYKNKLLFERESNNRNFDKKIGIPRILSMYENFPFFRELFEQCGFEVVLSDVSTDAIYAKGLGTVMADNICFPAKLAHGHIMNLIEKRVDRIFYPIIIYERNNIDGAINTYNCPIVASYADVLRSSIDPYNKYQIPFDSPPINFKDEFLLKSSCFSYLSTLGIDYETFNRAFDAAQISYLEYRTQVIKKAEEIIRDCRENNKPLFVFAQRPYHIDPLINQGVAKIVSDIGIDSITEDALEREELSFEEIFAIPQWAFINRIIKAARWVNAQSMKTSLVQINSFGCGPDSFIVDEAREIVNRGGHYYLLIRVDEFSNPGAIKLRLLSLKETLKNTKVPRKREFVSSKRYTRRDRYRKIIVPHFSDIYSPFIPWVFKNAGIDVEVLPPPDYKSVEYGLKYVNNEVCYPATIVIGDIIKALSEGRYERDKIAVALTQTGGQCRASNYVPLLKKAVIAAGFKDVPVVSIGFDGDVNNDQPGFYIEWKRLIKIAFISGLYADALARMYYASVAREKNRGESRTVLNRFIDAARMYVERSNYDGMMALLNNAVDSFNRIKVISEDVPKIGIVGEIFLKYNDFSNNNICEWLVEQGIEVIAPQIADFFMQFFVNVKVNTKSFMERASVKHLFAAVLEVVASEYINRVEKIISAYKFYSPSHDIFTKAYKAQKIVDLVNQFGEGWLIPAEVCSYAESGIRNVVSLQPFGCIANHIVSKGVEKVLKRYYPELNLLFLDFDSCTSEVNIFNRLYLMVKGAKELLYKDETEFSKGHYTLKELN
ncbi:MAG: acyl-CoA dehydratase activase [Myxococcota bacterium]